MTVLDQGPLRGPFFVLGVAVSCIALLAVGFRAPPVLAAGLYDVYLVDAPDDRLRIGTLAIDALDEDDGYRFTLDESVFGDYFLSMRPFHCVGPARQILCYLAYPYENRRRLTRNDLTDLEYDLLFIARSPKDYGIDPWNGRYFQLRWEGDVITGTMLETDLNVLAAPPADGGRRPLADADMVPVAPAAGQWVPRLLIEPR